jgi:GTP-binding protein YchF
MRLGIIGFPQSGKTTIFNALTRGDSPVTLSGGRIEVRTAVVDVRDERLVQLVNLFHPRKTTYAKVTYADITGLENGNGKNGNGNGRKGVSGQLLNQLSQMDGFVHVVRCFENSAVPHSAGTIDPNRDIASMDAELLLNDLITIEGKLGRLAEEKKKSVGREKSIVDQETNLFERFQNSLTSGIPLRDLELDEEEKRQVSGFGLLTLKPMLVILNLGDGQETPVIDCPHRQSAVLGLQGRLEMEMAQLEPKDVEMFMEEYGVEKLGLERVIRASYDLLGLQSFFTVGEDEVKAWTVKRGASALEAAGAIHTDLQKGFIRAEVVEYDTLITMGSLNEARSRGRLRLEGKNYQLHDGEIMHIRFNI